MVPPLAGAPAQNPGSQTPQNAPGDVTADTIRSIVREEMGGGGGAKKPATGPKKMTDEEQAMHNHQMKSLLTNLYQHFGVSLPYDILQQPAPDPQAQAQPQQKAAETSEPSMAEKIEAAFRVRQALERIQNR